MLQDVKALGAEMNNTKSLMCLEAKSLGFKGSGKVGDPGLRKAPTNSISETFLKDFIFSYLKSCFSLFLKIFGDLHNML